MQCTHAHSVLLPIATPPLPPLPFPIAEAWAIAPGYGGGGSGLALEVVGNAIGEGEVGESGKKKTNNKQTKTKQ